MNQKIKKILIRVMFISLSILIVYTLFNIYAFIVREPTNSNKQICKRFGDLEYYNWLLKGKNLRKECNSTYSIECKGYINYLYFYNKNCKDYSKTEEKLIDELYKKVSSSSTSP
jgi:hypothetical protein